MRGVPGTTSSVVVAIMSAPRMGTEERKGGREGNKGEKEDKGESPYTSKPTQSCYHNTTSYALTTLLYKGCP